MLLANCPACTIAMEACAGAHCLARKLQTFGHRVLLIAPQFVRPFVKGNKTDFADAEAICKAASRPSMRFVAVKTPEQQTLLALHRVREALVAERTATANQIHGFLLEFGVSPPVGARAIAKLPTLLDDVSQALPPRLVCILLRLHRRYGQLCDEIAQIEGELKLQLAEDEAGQRLLTTRYRPHHGQQPARDGWRRTWLPARAGFRCFSRPRTTTALNGRALNAAGHQQVSMTPVRQGWPPRGIMRGLAWLPEPH
ncbi:transposase [Paraburkholderia sp. 40]